MKEQQKGNLSKSIMLIIVTALLTFIITIMLVNNNTIKLEDLGVSEVEDSKYNALVSTLKNFKELLDEEYKGEINESDMLEGAIKGYIEGLGDEYTEYFTKEEMEEFTEDTEGEFEGIGVYIGQEKETENVVILSTIKDSPAEKAGLQAGDIITKVNEEDVLGAGSSLVSSKVRGESGTEVKIEVKRNDETKEFTVKRENVQMYHVETKVLENNIGYMGMSTFNENCAQEFEQKYKELQEQNITGLVVDLRYNGGGLVDEVLDIVDLFVDKGKDVLITVDKNGKEEIEKAKGEKIVTVPVVVLVNEYSASASEIMAAALKEQANAKIVGKTTYGKGVIQVLHPLKDGSGIKVTVKEYLTPNRNTINKVGVTPDYEVDVTEEQMDEALEDSSKDLQLQKAIEVLK